MRYMLLIYENEKNEQGDIQPWFDYTEAMQKAGVMKAGDALHPTSAATTVRVKAGETVTTDGPFAETREQLGGYYLVDCKDLDEAIRWAAKMPNADRGSIEIRPVMDFDQG